MEQSRNSAAIQLALRHYWKQIRKDWRYNLPGLLLPGVGTVLIFYLPPLVVARVLVRFAHQTHPPAGALFPYILLFAAFWTLGEISWRIAIHLLIRSEAKGSKRLYIYAMKALLKQDLAFFHNNFAGALTKKAVGYAKKYEEFIDTLTFSVVTNILPLPVLIVILWHFSWVLVAILLGLIGLTMVLVIPLIKRRQKLVATREAASNIVAGHISDTITNMEAVRAYAHEDFESQTHQHHVSDYITKAQRSWDYQNLRVDAVTSPLFVLVNALGLSAALFLNRQGVISLEAVFVSFSYYILSTRVMWEFNRIYRNIETALTEAAQFTQLLLEPPTLHDAASPINFRLRSGAVEFQNVSFRYHDKAGEHLFNNFNLKIKSGEKVALVGRSGGGKTTITKLLLRFMDINNGAILIDGYNIAKVKQTDLRAAIAYVPQDPLMFHRSIKDNIRYGKLSATDAQIEQVAALAHADEFIKNLPQGYDTLVGERGIKLSGGQRQRIAIARAMIKDAPILVLDEATSSLDSESEGLIQDALWKLMKDHTAIVIAHRLSTIQKMDRIIVLDEGQIVEAGNHRQLLDQGGLYASLWTHQSGGFLED